MDEEAGQDKNRDGETEQSEDGYKGRDGLGYDGEYGHGTFDGKVHRAEMFQIESDAESLCPGREDRSDRLPAHQHSARDDGIFKEQAEGEKHGAVADARERRRQEIGAQLAQTRAVKNVRTARRAEAAISEEEAGKNGDFEEGNGNDRAGEKFSNHEDFSSDRHEKLVVESALDHFAPEQPGEYPHAGEKDAQTEVVKLDKSGEDFRIILDARCVCVVSAEDVVNDEEHYGKKSEQINPNPTAREKVSAN